MGLQHGKEMDRDGLARSKLLISYSILLCTLRTDCDRPSIRPFETSVFLCAPMPSCRARGRFPYVAGLRASVGDKGTRAKRGDLGGAGCGWAQD